MNDDWRLQIDPADESGDPGSLVERLHAGELEHELSDAFHDRVIVSRDGDTVFLYAATREQIERAGAAVEKLAAQHGWAIDTDLRRWHTEADEWEDPEVPLPSNDAERAAEREELIAAERQAVAEGGEPQFEVRVDLPSHRDAARFEDALRAEGLPAVRRWKYLVLGAADEESGRELAQRLEEEAPAGSTVTLETNERVVYEDRPSNPFAIFGGLGG
jgi:transposase-like protein